MLDADLAQLYGVKTKHLNQAIKRNPKRFPVDFMFRLTFQELRNLRSQIVTSKKRKGGRRNLPYAFTEHGAFMAANVLKSSRAVLVSIHVVRAFVRLREMMMTHKDLSRKIDELEEKYDTQFRVVFQAIRQLMEPPVPFKRRIGFQSESKETLKDGF